MMVCDSETDSGEREKKCRDERKKRKTERKVLERERFLRGGKNGDSMRRRVRIKEENSILHS